MQVFVTQELIRKSGICRFSHRILRTSLDLRRGVPMANTSDMAEIVREAQFEDLFYPASATELRRWLAVRLDHPDEAGPSGRDEPRDDASDKAEQCPAGDKREASQVPAAALAQVSSPKLLHVPHGALESCGDLLARTLAPLRAWAEHPAAGRVIILAPALSGCEQVVSYPISSVFRSPLGDSFTDQDFVANLSSFSMSFGPDETAHLQEYAIEVLLPFLQVLCPRIPIVPLLVAPSIPERQAKSVASALAAASSEGSGSSVFILCANASTPLPEPAANAACDAILEYMLAGNYQALLDAANPNLPPGSGIRAVGLLLARLCGAEHLLLTGRAESPEIDDTNNVVKYLGFVAY